METSTIKAILISKGDRKGKRPAKAQVVVRLPSGKQVTCHLIQSVDGRWIGLNPDKAVMAVLADVERVLSVAKRRLADAKTFLGIFENAKGEEAFDEEDIEAGAAEVGNARESLTRVESELAVVRANAPRKPYFEF